MEVYDTIVTLRLRDQNIGNYSGPYSRYDTLRPAEGAEGQPHAWLALPTGVEECAQRGLHMPPRLEVLHPGRCAVCKGHTHNAKSPIWLNQGIYLKSYSNMISGMSLQIQPYWALWEVGTGSKELGNQLHASLGWRNIPRSSKRASHPILLLATWHSCISSRTSVLGA